MLYNRMIRNIVAGDGVLSVFKINYATILVLFSSLSHRATKFESEEEVEIGYSSLRKDVVQNRLPNIH